MVQDDMLLLHLYLFRPVPVVAGAYTDVKQFWGVRGRQETLRCSVGHDNNGSFAID